MVKRVPNGKTANLGGLVRVSACAILAMGVLLAVAGALEWWVGVKAERTADLVRPDMTDAGLARHRQDFETARIVLVGLDKDVLPATAAGLGTTPARLRGQIDANYPAVAKLLAEKDLIVPFAELGVSNLERHQEQFQRADELPVTWLPGYALAFLNLALAAAVIASGIVLLRSRAERTRRAAFGVVLAASAILIVVSLALEIPDKARNAQTVLDSLVPTQQVVDRTEASLATARAASTELDQRLFPDLATALGTTPLGFQQALAREFPAIAVALTEIPGTLDHYDARVAIRTAGAPDLRTLKGLPVGTLGWFAPAFGLLLAMVAIGGVLASRRMTPLSESPDPAGT